MQLRSRTSLVAIVVLLAMLVALPLLSACSSEEETSELSVFEVIQEAAIDYLTSSPDYTMSADELETLITDAVSGNDPIIVDVRPATSYAAGHIDGAINIGLADLAAAASLAQLDKDTQIVTYCVTGHTGSQAAAIWNMLGYDGTATAKTTTMKFGMCGWDASQQTSCYTAPTANKSVVTAASTAGTYDLPDLGTSTDSEEDILIAAAAAYLASGPDWTMSADELETLITDAVSGNDPIIVDIRGASSYEAGHIEGAINIPLADLANTDSLKKLDPDTQIVTYCVTGHTGSQAAAILNMLGYDATTMKHGMCGWDASQQTSCYTAPTTNKTVVT